MSKVKKVIEFLSTFNLVFFLELYTLTKLVVMVAYVAIDEEEEKGKKRKALALKEKLTALKKVTSKGKLNQLVLLLKSLSGKVSDKAHSAKVGLSKNPPFFSFLFLYIMVGP